MRTRRFYTILLALFLCSCISNADIGIRYTNVHTTTKTLPVLPIVDILEPDKFLNDLRLSPLWKVDRENGFFVAHARAVGPEWPSESGEFLFELLSRQDAELHDYQIRNDYIRGDDPFNSFSAEIVFQRPSDQRISYGTLGQDVELGIYEPFGDTIGPNSSSQLAIKLSTMRSIYLILYEQGEDESRSTTFEKLPVVLQAIADVADLPQEYQVQEQYKALFDLLFELPLGSKGLGKFPGIQDRDTFYGYLRVQPGTSYNGINIKISHPVYCSGECTWEPDRLEKAEYLGTPYYDTDVLFFLIEDNAVYLPGKYDEEFGTFSGTSSFEGTLQVLNADGQVLLETTEKFKGWEQ